MKIVVLDGYVANSGDLSWGPIAQLGQLEVFDRTAPHEVVERAAGATAIFTNKVVIDRDMMQQLPDLKFIGVLATGFNNVDLIAARRQGITVCNVPRYSTHSVAQTIFAHLLNITNRTALHDESVKEGKWTTCADFSFRLTPIIELAGLTLGIYGLGSIGSEVAKIADAFSMHVVAYTTRVPWQLPKYITPVEKNELFEKSDVLVLSAPLTSENKHFINADTLAMMKPSAIIINAARGGLIDSEALANALSHNKIYAAGIDVLPQEPPKADEPLQSAPNCFITPHIAWQSDAARQNLIEKSAESLAAYLAGAPINVVN